MVIMKADLTEYAREGGVWEHLCAMAGVDPDTTETVWVEKVKPNK